MHSLKKTLNDIDDELKMSVEYDHQLMKRQIEEARILRSKETVRLIKLAVNFVGMPIRASFIWVKDELKSHQENKSIYGTVSKNLQSSTK